jgi:hypothetical protein
MSSAFQSLTLRSRISCPHCWHEFAPEESLWIASDHPNLYGDLRLGDDQTVRFMPSRFTHDGEAIDPEGQKTTRLACPSCHLEIPRPLYQIQPIFFSILGAPASGKSYFLASMTWQLRQILPSRFGIAMTDTDTVSNARLHEYEEQQFLNPNPESVVAIAKTQLDGDFYDRVNLGTHVVSYPRPFLFNMRPMAQHPNYSKSQSVSRVMCLYDNAGEHFLPGSDSAMAPVTRHLALSRALFFLFDPTQDARFRRACQGKTSDPQMQHRTERLARESTTRQDTILIEAIQRVRRHAGLREDEMHQRPLIVVVTKWDSWRELLPAIAPDPLPYRKAPNSSTHILDGERVQEVSNQLAELLRTLTPEIVAAAEGFTKHLLFVPVSATGCAPEQDEATGAFGVRPKNLNPYWVEVPMLYALSRWSSGLIGMTRSVGKPDKSQS